MILTFEVNKSRTGLDIHFDKEGRDHLLELLSSLEEVSDHQHIFMEPHGDISPKRFDVDSSPMEMVTLYLLSPDTEPVALARVEYLRKRDGKTERVEEIGGVEVNVVEVEQPSPSEERTR